MVAQHLFILTGASRGMGRAMAGQLLQAGHTLITLARSPLPLPPQPLATHLHWPHDLTAPEAAAGQLLAWLQACRASDYASATLINNAAADHSGSCLLHSTQPI